VLGTTSGRHPGGCPERLIMNCGFPRKGLTIRYRERVAGIWRRCRRPSPFSLTPKRLRGRRVAVGHRAETAQFGMAAATIVDQI
jgi:hypothetical protein